MVQRRFRATDRSHWTNSHRIQYVEREPADTEHETDPDEEVAGPLHPQDVVLDPLHDDVGALDGAPESAAASAAAAGVGRQLTQFLLHANSKLAKDLVVRDGDGDGGEQVLDEHRHRGVHQSKVDKSNSLIIQKLRNLPEFKIHLLVRNLCIDWIHGP